jgi:hypothetical protein
VKFVTAFSLSLLPLSRIASERQVWTGVVLEKKDRRVFVMSSIDILSVSTLVFLVIAVALAVRNIQIASLFEQNTLSSEAKKYDYVKYSPKWILLVYILGELRRKRTNCGRWDWKMMSLET